MSDVLSFPRKKHNDSDALLFPPQHSARRLRVVKFHNRVLIRSRRPICSDKEGAKAPASLFPRHISINQ